MADVGFVGLGAMGGRMAGRLLGSHRVHGWNRSAVKAEGLIRDGLIWCDSPRQVAEAARVIFTMVTDGPALTAIVCGPDGILAGLRPGGIVVDLSTIGPDTATEIGEWVAERGGRMVSAPVAGTITAAADGTLVIMAGGPPDTVAAVQPLLGQLARRVVPLGTQAQAVTLKLAINLNLAAQMLAFSEGLVLAEQAGVEPALAANVLVDSAIGSVALWRRAPLMLDLPDEPWFDIRSMIKDILLAQDVARCHGVTADTATAVENALERAAEQGYSRRDIAALYTALRERTPIGNRLPTPRP
ncbi:NAD(P)-dependent oxidoreductase [Nocardia sp. NPDC127526]|uniref:NAD(P)-dependent oxidoreductase n=1 Tax=Nocardia sp. NPDC127526 TaxID=3345393 RepID=UPI00362E16E1